MPHEDYSINLRWSRALSAIEGEIPSSAAIMAVIDAKNTIPENTQASFVWWLVENTFLQKLIKWSGTISNRKNTEFDKGGNKKWHELSIGRFEHEWW